MTVMDMTDQVIRDLVSAPEPPAEPALDRPTLHSLLLRLAGRVPDDDLATMRMCLADGQADEVASLLATVAESGRLPLLDAENVLVRALFAEYQEPQRIADRVPRIELLPPAPYRFAGESGTEASWDAGAAPFPSAPPAEVTDAMDAVAVEAADRVGGLIGLWRAFRRSKMNVEQRVYLGEADPAADVVELAAEMQHALAEAGEDPPSVEIFPAGAVLAPYHDAALEAATLVWAETEPPVRLARAFDGADPDAGPFFRPDHPRLERDDGERVLAYLRGAELVLNAPGAMDDVLDAGLGLVVPAGFRSDGRWVWPDAAAYYLKRYRLAPDPELTAYALTAPSPRPLNRLARHWALAALFAPNGVEPVWQAG